MDFCWYSCLGFVALVWLGVVVSSCLALDRGRAARRWPTTTGVVLSSSIQETRTTNYLPLGSSWFPVRGGFIYTPVVEYQYTVADREYRGTRIRFGGPIVSGSHADAQRVLESYPPGAAVTVLYNPSRPEIATLESGAHPRVVLVAIATVVFGVLVIFILGALFVRSLRRLP